MTEKYNDNFEQLHLVTKIKKEFEGYYCFEETIFYGEKGGMLADKGTINGQEVKDIYFHDGEWYHQTDGKLSDPIVMEVDRETRYTNTAIQSLLHLLDGYYRPLGLTLIAVGVKPENQWYEIDTKELEEDHLAKVQAYLDQAVRDDVKVAFHYVSPQEYGDERYKNFPIIRLVQFGEYDIQPCGTLHVNHTSQIGTPVILSCEKTSRGTRIFLTCGNSTRDFLKKTYLQGKEVAAALGCSREEVVEKAGTLSAAYRSLNKENSNLKAKIREYVLKELASSSERIVVLENMSAKELGILANSLAGDYGKNIFLISGNEEETALAIASADGKARELLNELSSGMELRGGGSPKVVSVNCARSLGEVKNLLESLVA